MANISITRISPPPTLDYQGIQILSWVGLAMGDVGVAAELVNFADRSVQVAGSFSGSATLVIEGSIDGINYHTLTDPQGDPLAFTAGGIQAITEVVRYIRPAVNFGDGSTSLTVHILFRRG